MIDSSVPFKETIILQFQSKRGQRPIWFSKVVRKRPCRMNVTTQYEPWSDDSSSLEQLIHWALSLPQLRIISWNTQPVFGELAVDETQVEDTLPRVLKGVPAQPCDHQGGRILAWGSESHSQPLGQYLATLLKLYRPPATSPTTRSPALNPIKIPSANKILPGPPQKAMLFEKCSSANLYQLRTSVYSTHICRWRKQETVMLFSW